MIPLRGALRPCCDVAGAEMQLPSGLFKSRFCKKRILLNYRSSTMASVGSLLRIAAIVLVAGYTTNQLYSHLTASVEPDQPKLSPAAQVVSDTIANPVAIFR